MKSSVKETTWPGQEQQSTNFGLDWLIPVRMKQINNVLLVASFEPFGDVDMFC